MAYTPRSDHKQPTGEAKKTAYIHSAENELKLYGRYEMNDRVCHRIKSNVADSQKLLLSICP